MRWRKGRYLKNDYEIKWTRSRRIILDIFKRAKEHLSADEVFLIVRKNYPTIGIATVYRTLDFLYRRGLLSRFQFGNNKASYELSPEKVSERKHHHHLICTGCGRVIDYTDFAEKETKLVSEMEVQLSKKYDFKISSHQLHFYGLCKKCQRMSKNISSEGKMVLKGGD